VFLQGIMGDGDLDWRALLPHVTGRFACHLPSWRGRGLSGDHPDRSFGRLVDDVRAYVDSISEPTGLVGWSAGANLALVAAGSMRSAQRSTANPATSSNTAPNRRHNPGRAQDRRWR
jgi:pimeloyl-ACP methyl ester carboxylesterase